MPEPEFDELITELRELGRSYAVPEALDQRTAVRRRLARTAPRRHRGRFYLSAVIAALVLAVAALSPARAAVIDAVGGLLRAAGVELRRDGPPGALPVTPSPLPSEASVDLAEAKRRAKFPIVAPDVLGSPDRVLLADPDPDGAPRVVSLVYRSGTVRFDQFDGTLEPVFMKTAPDAQWVEIGDSAVWLPAAHPVTYIGRDGVSRTETARLAGPTLIWATGSVTYRLEGLATLEEASEVARSVR
ncbi:hypothetical protein [Actinoplanes awajinensis]|uniref:DUF4367 domain-containing protein n=1 Tax=Actinoplanes awajinensis subsp. mycoplanecinus TaxID=135947 RepID=A0A0X3UTV7_9ACTN|nr:hypothetical protein [Actinoplanes awajinensis]KUL35242.1 hypothetical protein ADL15_14560 [Actinoplanes awajinensis subsp. mycoplanecinus]